MISSEWSVQSLSRIPSRSTGHRAPFSFTAVIGAWFMFQRWNSSVSLHHLGSLSSAWHGIKWTNWFLRMNTYLISPILVPTWSFSGLVCIYIKFTHFYFKHGPDFQGRAAEKEDDVSHAGNQRLSTWTPNLISLRGSHWWGLKGTGDSEMLSGSGPKLLASVRSEGRTDLETASSWTEGEAGTRHPGPAPRPPVQAPTRPRPSTDAFLTSRPAGQHLGAHKGSLAPLPPPSEIPGALSTVCALSDFPYRIWIKPEQD